MVKKLVILEEGGSIFIDPIEIDDDGNVVDYADWVKEFIVDQTNLVDMHKAFERHVTITREKHERK